MPLFLAAILTTAVSIHHPQSVDKKKNNAAIYSNEEGRREFCSTEKSVKSWGRVG